jgi:hypothetical protein
MDASTSVTMKHRWPIWREAAAYCATMTVKPYAFPSKEVVDSRVVSEQLEESSVVCGLGVDRLS